MKCLACNREAVDDVCRFHSAARERVRAAYPLWKRAYGKIDWEDYLDNIKRNPQTGQWAKEVADLMRRDT